MPAPPSDGRSAAPALAAIPPALEALDVIVARIGRARPALFLDFDGTLAPIADRPENAVMPDDVRAAVTTLARRWTVAIVSGRARHEVERLVGIKGICYAGSHGFDIAVPGGRRIERREAAHLVPAVHRAGRMLSERLKQVPGAIVEDKDYTVAVHYRLVPAGRRDEVARAVADTAAANPELRRIDGKMVYELRPATDWNKGSAVLWLLSVLGLAGPDAIPVFVGDDVTDEDAFRAITAHGIGILVAEEPRATAAAYRLAGTQEVAPFLRALDAALTARPPAT